MEPYTHARLEAGFRRYTRYAELSSALYADVLDVVQQRAILNGIRQAARIHYRHSQLVALHAHFADQFAAGDQSGEVHALEAVATLTNAPVQ